MRPVCRHCRKSVVTRPRGLCWSCYYRPGVKQLYPSMSKYARHGEGNATGPHPLPASPTSAAPGSAEKLGVLAERVRRGESLFHPGDFNLPTSTSFATKSPEFKLHIPD
jgi:hypothetical protein